MTYKVYFNDNTKAFQYVFPQSTGSGTAFEGSAAYVIRKAYAEGIYHLSDLIDSLIDQDADIDMPVAELNGYYAASYGRKTWQMYLEAFEFDKPGLYSSDPESYEWYQGPVRDALFSGDISGAYDLLINWLQPAVFNPELAEFYSEYAFYELQYFINSYLQMQ